MTREDYLKTNRKDWDKFTDKKAFDDLLVLMREQSPIAQSLDRPAGDHVVGNNVLSAEESGWLKAIRFLKDLAKTSPEIPEPESKYQEAEKI